MKNTILNKVSSLAKKSLTLCPPPFAGKAARGLCTILLLCASMMSWAEPVTYTGAGFSGAINSYTYDIGYSITYDDDHHLTFNVTLDGTFQETDGFVFEVWSADLSTGNFKSLVHGEGNAWSVTDDKDYQLMEGQSLNQLRLRLASTQGGIDQLYLSDYTVGLSGSAVVNGPTTRATTPSAPSNKVKAIYSWYYAKGCNFADWGGGTSSQNMRYGKKLSCTRPEGNGWLGLVDFGDLDCSAMDKFHMDIWVENDASMRLTPIHVGFGEEYRHVINLTGGQWNSIELDLNAETFVSDASVGAPNDYWDVINQFKIDLLANGLNFWIDNVYFYSNQSPVFSSISINGPKICKVGENFPLTIETLDQFGQHIDAEYTCSVLPVSAGTIVGNTYTPSAKGAATITATSGLISNSLNVYNYEGDNLALNKLESQSAEFSGYGAARAVDGNDGTEWQGSPTGSTGGDDAARTYDCWFTVNLADKYDIDLITIHFEGACSDAYHIDFSADGTAWETVYNFSGALGINNHTDYITSFTHNSAVQYVRFWSTKASTGYGMKMFEFQVFGSESATPTKSVSASVNDALMGTATVKQNGDPVTEVETGSTVTFSAVANDGYVFVNWSNGNTNATFNATVDAAMNLTANFRAQGTVYCNTEVTSTRDDDVHVAYATMKRTSANNYKLVVRSAETLGNFSNTTLQVNGSENLNLNNQGTLTDNNHMLTYEFTSTTPPSMTSGYMYLNVPGSKFTECWFTRLTNIEYEVPCDDEDVPVESISLNYDEATIEIGATKTLLVSFNPVYATDKSITWTSSNGTVASVDGGVVTANTVGTATITAEASNGKTATCAVTVEPVTEKTCWGTGTDFTYDDRTISWYYSVTRNENKTLTYYAEFSSSVAGLGNLDVVIDNDVWKHMTYNASTMSASYTTEGTYETGAVLNDFFYFEGRRQDFSYTVGSECAKPTVDVTGVSINHTSAELLVGETLTLSAEVVPANADDKVIIWENSDETVASFNTSTGEITALAEGTTTITAKSHFDEDIYATCVVTVSSAITAKTWYGVATFTPNEGLTGFTYSITRNTDRSLTFSVVLDKNPVGFVGEVCISGSYKGMSYSASTLTATYTTDANYAADGDALNAYWWLKSADNADGVDFTYTVGSENDPLPQAVAVDETKDNTAILTTYDGVNVVGVLGRSFTASNLYTLVLPFDVDAAQMAAKLPGKLTKLGGVRKKANDDMYLNFVDVSSMEAGVAYLYTPSEDVTNPVFENVVVKKDLVSPSYEGDGYSATYTGIYDAIDVKATITGTDKYVLGSDQWLYNVSEMPQTMTMNAFRGYFTLNFGTNAAPGRRARVVFGDIDDNPMATDLEALDNKQLPDKRIENGQLLIIRNGHTYNAQGQLLR